MTLERDWKRGRGRERGEREGEGVGGGRREGGKEGERKQYYMYYSICNCDIKYRTFNFMYSEGGYIIAGK